MRTYKTDKCSYCEQTKRIKIKGLCDSCYVRQRTTGTLEYKKKGKVFFCKIENCGERAVAHSMCDMHYRRTVRHGHSDSIRPVDWGDRNIHPLYAMWKNLRRFKRKQLCDEWLNDFWQFVNDVKERPSKNHLLKPIDNNAEFSGTNFFWHKQTLKGLLTEEQKKCLRNWVKLDRE